MKCRKCGSKIDKQAEFCRYCGTPVGRAASSRKKKKRKAWPVIVIFLVLILLLVGAGTGYFLLHEPQKDTAGEMKAMTSMSESQDELDTADDSENDSNNDDVNDENSQAGTSMPDSLMDVDINTVEDYSNNLDPDQYAYYDSGISDFNFYYPIKLYNEVTVEESSSSTNYGTSLQKIHFKGTKGSELIFEISRRNDSMSLDEMREKVYQTESGSMSDTVTVLNRLSEERTHGKVIVSGYSNPAHDKAMYDMVKIEDDYVLQMKVIFPYTPDDMENNRQQNYVVDCLYRLCGFSDTSYESTRSYDEFRQSLKNS